MNGAVTTEYETVDREKLLADIRSFTIVDAVKSVSCKTIQKEKSEQGLYQVRSDGFWLQKKYCSFAKKPWLRRNDRPF